MLSPITPVISTKRPFETESFPRNVERRLDSCTFDSLPFDLVSVIFFQYLTISYHKNGKLVCKRWFKIWNDPLNLKKFVPKLNCWLFGVSLSCTVLINLANRYRPVNSGSNEGPKRFFGYPDFNPYLKPIAHLDLKDVEPSDSSAFSLLRVPLASLKIRNCAIQQSGLEMLIGCLAKTNASLKVDSSVNLAELFTLLYRSRVVLKKLVIRANADDTIDANKNMNRLFRQFAANGLVRQGCMLDLQSERWISSQTIRKLTKIGIRFKRLGLPSSNEIPLAELIFQNRLEASCDLRYVQTDDNLNEDIIGNRVIPALIQTGTTIRQFCVKNTYDFGHVTHELCKQFFMVFSRPRAEQEPWSFALYNQYLCYKEIAAGFLIQNFSLDDHDDSILEYEEYCAHITHLLSLGNWTNPCNLEFKRTTICDPVLEAIAAREDLVIKSLKLKHPQTWDENVTVTDLSITRMFQALKRRQSSLELELIGFNQATVETLAQSGLKFTKLTLVNLEEKICILPLLLNGALDNCQSLWVSLTELSETLEQLKRCQELREMIFEIDKSHEDTLKQFLKKNVDAFKNLIRLIIHYSDNKPSEFFLNKFNI